MKHTKLLAPSRSLLAILLVGACSSSDEGVTELIDPGPSEGACSIDTEVGSFSVSLEDAFTSVQGQVESGVTPLRVAEAVESVGSCALWSPPALFCDPACDASSTCNKAGECQQIAQALSVGKVLVDGLSAAVEMEATAPVYFYTFRGTLAHPGVAEGDRVILNAAGEGNVEAFALGGTGVASLVTELDEVTLQDGQPIALTWTPPALGESELHIELNIAQHGGTPGRIECLVPDTGSFEIPVQLTDALAARGFSGFPSLTMTRRSADSTTTSAGCVQLLIESRTTIAVAIPGLTSCSGDEDCLAPESCQPDLTCGED